MKTVITSDFSQFSSSSSQMFSGQQEQVTQLGASFYQILIRIAVWGLLICLVILAMTIMWYKKDRDKRGELKNKIVRIILVAIVLFSLTGIFSAIQSIGEQVSVEYSSSE